MTGTAVLSGGCASVLALATLVEPAADSADAFSMRPTALGIACGAGEVAGFFLAIAEDESRNTVLTDNYIGKGKT